jgi:hypothetical protein
MRMGRSMFARKMVFVFVSTLLVACDVFLPPKPARPPAVPAEASLVFRQKSGWGWDWCLDVPNGGVRFQWGASGERLYTTAIGISCSAPVAEERKHLRVAGTSPIRFSFPEEPVGSSEPKGGDPCPFEIQPAELASLKGYLLAAVASQRLRSQLAAETLEMAGEVEKAGNSPLEYVGGEGNTDGWSIRCSPARE